MTERKWYYFFWVAVLAAVVLFFVVTLSWPAGALSGGQSPNSDPHNGQVVKLFPGTDYQGNGYGGPVTKQCDGPNLVYLTPYQAYGGGSIAVIPDSVECR